MIFSSSERSFTKMSVGNGGHTPVLEWTRMTSRDHSPYFVPRPTPGYTSAYDTEKVRRNVPSINFDKSVGRERASRSTMSEEEVSEKPTSPKPEYYRYGVTEEEIEEYKRREKKRKFLRERSEYVKKEGKMNRVIGACSMKRSTGRDSPVFWQSKQADEKNPAIEPHTSVSPTRRSPEVMLGLDFDDQQNDTNKPDSGAGRQISNPDHPSSKFSKPSGFTIAKANRFQKENEAPAPAPLPTNTRLDSKTNTSHSSGFLKPDVGTFGRAPPRPEPKADAREDLSVNYEYTKGHLTRAVHLSRYAFRKGGDEEKPSTKYKQLFKHLQRPHVPLSDRLRSTSGMATMVSSRRGDLPSILRHADNDRLRAMTSMAMNDTSSHVREILYPEQSYAQAD